jgi:hypothetical protein
MDNNIYPENCEIGELYYSIVHNYKFVVKLKESKKVFELVNEPGSFAHYLDKDSFLKINTTK